MMVDVVEVIGVDKVLNQKNKKDRVVVNHILNLDNNMIVDTLKGILDIKDMACDFVWREKIGNIEV